MSITALTNTYIRTEFRNKVPQQKAKIWGNTHLSESAIDNFLLIENCLAEDSCDIGALFYGIMTGQRLMGNFAKSLKTEYLRAWQYTNKIDG